MTQRYTHLFDQPGAASIWAALTEGPAPDAPVVGDLPAPITAEGQPLGQDPTLEALDRTLGRQVPAISLSLDEGAIGRILDRCRQG